MLSHGRTSSAEESLSAVTHQHTQAKVQALLNRIDQVFGLPRYSDP